MAHARLGREVHDRVEAAAREDFLHRSAVGDVGADEFEASERAQLREACLLEADVVVRVHVVQPDDRVPARQQALAKVEADESGGAGDEGSHESSVRVRAPIGSEPSWRS